MEMLKQQEFLKFTAIVSGGMLTGTAVYISLIGVRSRLPIKATRESFNGAATCVVCLSILSNMPYTIFGSHGALTAIARIDPSS